MKNLCLALLLFCLTACGGTIGFPGSPAWQSTAPASVQRDYYQGICLDKGYGLGTKKMEACIRGKPSDPNERSSSWSAIMNSPSPYEKSKSANRRIDNIERGLRTQCINRGGVYSSGVCRGPFY